MTEHPGRREMLRARALRQLYLRGVRYANRWSRRFTTLHERPKFTGMIGTWGEP